MNAILFLKKSSRILFAAVLIAILLSATQALAAGGTLDPTFGSNGVVTTNSSSARDIALQADGKILILGSIKLNDEQSQRVLTRYNSNGTVDTSFGTNGSIPIEVESFSGSKIAFQPDGKLIVGGSGKFVRYNSNGTLDTSFGTNGMGIIDLGRGAHGYFADFTIQSDGKIVVAGDTQQGDANYAEFFVARLTSNGAPDSTFAFNGLNVIWDFPGYRYDTAGEVVIQPDGKIVMSGGMMDQDGKDYLALARLNPDGSLDKSTFGSNGHGTVTTPMPGFQRGALALQADGKIIMTGTNTGTLAVLARFNTNGSLDATFGGGGIVTTDFGTDQSVDDFVIQADGKIIVEGKTSSEDTWNDFLLVRYNRDGSLDTTFGTNGKVVTDFGNTNDIVTGIAQQPDGKVIVIGNSGENAILARYDTGISITTTSLTFKSAGANDGWILEFLENINKGGTLDKTSNIINVGDDAKDRQYRGILSFDTSSIPDNVIITSAQVKVKRQSFVGTNPFKTHVPLLLEIRNGTFNNDIALTLEDFSAIADAGSTQDQFSGADANWIHTATLSNVNLGLINKVGVTQFRLLFSMDDNDNMSADYIKLFSGNSISDQPQLIVTYSTTSGGTNSRPPVITSNDGGTTASINVPENSTTVTTVTANDPEQQPLIYLITGGADAALFRINPSVGTLSFVTAPSYNVPNDAGLDHIYNVTVQVSDGELTDSQELVVSIINPNLPTGEMLDPTYGSHGVVTTKINGLPSSASEVVLQPDGKVVTLGTVKLSAEQSKKVITRYNNNGALDASFGTNGSTLIEVTPFSGSKIALQPDGKLVVAGISDGDFAVVRYQSNGTLDTSFGKNGMGVLDLDSESHQSLADLMILPDGKIMMVGDYTYGQSNHIDFYIVRFNTDGSPYNGYQTIDWYDFPSSRYNYGKAVVIQPDNKIVLSGDMLKDDDGKKYISLARLSATSVLDKSAFGTNGKGTVTALLPNFKNSSGALALQPDGKIVVAGTIFSTNDVPENLALARFNTDGSLDTTFGGAGIVVTDFGAAELADDLVIQTSGKIILAGTTSNLGSSDFMLVRYNSDGSLDTSFGTNGKVVTDFGDSAEAVTGIVQQPDGKVIVSGTSGENAILARYNAGLSTSATSFTFNSVGSYDGWILESGEFSNAGGTLDKISNVIFVGDDVKDRQYRSILSFDTNSIPDNAAVTSAQVKIKKQTVVGTDPFNTHGNLLLEIRNGTFSNNVALTLDDFAAIANVGSTQDKFSAADSSWYTASLSNVNLGLVNKVGDTQFRLLFSRDDNDDLGADYVKFFSGNAASDLPQLIVTYSTGGGGTANQAPVINGGSTLSISIPENTTTVTGVTAADPEGQPITYAISGADAGKFSINPSTGILAFLSPPDFEAIPSGTVYHVTAQASDGSLTSAQDISVTVTPVNEFAPVVTSNININLPENTIDVTTITVTDADLPRSIEYVFAGGADDSLFTIDQATGKLSFVTAPSYNAPNDAGLDHIYNVKFEIQDGEHATPLELVISITNSNPPSGAMQDATFGSNGVVTTKVNGLPSSTWDIILQPDGKVVTLGTAQSQKVVTRYNNNGTLDTSFGTNGSITIEVTPFSAKKLALQPDGKLIVAGQQKGFAVVRYNSNGTLDASFGTNGLAALYPGNTSSDIYYYVEDVAIQPDGKIVMVGSYSIGNHIEIEVVRFNSDGTRDAINSLDWDTFGSQYNYGKAVTIQPDNKIVVSGDMVSCCDTYQYISLARLDPDMRLDRSSFGSGKGAVTARLNHFQHSSGAIALQPDGRIIVAGTILGTDWKTPQNMVMARFNTDGSLDTTFGGTGIVITDFGANEQADDFVIQANGKILLAGTTSSAGASDFLLVRYNSDGSLDTSFGTSGKLTSDFGNSAESVSGIVQQPDGKVIVSGTSGENAILARYVTGASGETTSTSFKSIGTYDGWILESGENSNAGGSLDKAAKVVFVGDDEKDRQFRSILSFDTNSIPDNATITSAQVKIKKQTVVGTDPFNTHGNLLLEIRKGSFSNNIGLTLADFSAIADSSSTQDTFSATDASWYTTSLSNTNLGLVNKVGATQFRLSFSKDDNDNLIADYIKFFSGDSTTSQPELFVTYSTPSGGGTGNHAPVINGGPALSVHTPENTTLVSGVTAIDPDGQSITYSISGADAGLFSITPTGVLSFVTPPDFEAIPPGTAYHVTAKASDGSLTTTQDIAVTVTPINEFAPVMTSSGGTDISLPENTLDVTTITTTDADLSNPPIKYLLGGLDWSLFNLDSATGKFSFITPPSYSAPNDSDLDHVYNININADDGRFSVWLSLSITITDPNSARASSAGFTTLHQFGSQADNGRIPYGSLVQYNGVFYGTTTYGGPPYNLAPTNPDNKGNVFKMNMDGSGFTVLHEFTGGDNDGWKPWSGLAIAGDMIYGSTVYGGPHGENGGVIYEMNINGSGFRVLHAFGESGDGFGGSTSPTLVGDTLYGITRWGGNGTGTIYSYNTTSEVYTQLYRFAANSSDGNAPLGSLTAANDGYLYGLTWLGGTNNMGTLFRIKQDGSAFETLYNFAGGAQGKYPYDTLAFDGNHTLYGTTLGEYGVNLTDLGTIFKYDIASKIYSVLHKFAGGVNDSGKPNGSVVLSSDGITLYGTTHGDDAWGGKEYGILYQMNLDGTGFKLLYEFSGGSSAGATPMRTPLFIDGALYGMTAYGGSENYGLIYRFQVADAAMSQKSFAALNINSYTPTITSSNAISVSENSIALTTVTATDADMPAQPLTYSIVGGADSALFSINPSTGELGYIAAPDYETPTDAGLDNIYNITIQVSDGVVAVTQEIAVTITSVNDNNPVITSNNAILIPENTTAVTTLTATDADIPAKLLTFSIVGGSESALFNVNSSTGELNFITAPNYEIPTDAGADNAYNITVQVSDGELVSTQDVVVTVSSVNDNNPAATSTGAVAISENTAAVTTVTATDADLPTQSLTYSIAGGVDAPLFNINSSTGELNFITAPDFEIPKDAGADNIYNFAIQISDGELVSTQDLAVTVNAVNDNSPVITSVGNLSIAENNTGVTTVTASDADLPTQPLTYSIAGGSDSALFNINSSTGELTFIAAPDYEAPADTGLDNIYNVTVQASDGALAIAQDISVTITAINDNSPVITSPEGFAISENVIDIATITATDADLPAQTLTYSIVDGADSALFSVNSSTGGLTFITAHDYEMSNDIGSDNIYNVKVQVSDGMLTITQDIAITIMPVNDNNPVIISLNNFSIPENTSTVTTITATDADRPAESLTYSIIGGLDAVKFSIVSTTGEIKFITAPDFEVPVDFNVDNIYEVVVQVSDGTFTSAQNISTQVTNGDN